MALDEMFLRENIRRMIKRVIFIFWLLLEMEIYAVGKFQKEKKKTSLRLIPSLLKLNNRFE